jgi:hypothetical protein
MQQYKLALALEAQATVKTIITTRKTAIVEPARLHDSHLEYFHFVGKCNANVVAKGMICVYENKNNRPD